MAENKYEYLDLLNRKLDPSQKEACCRTQNTIVAAGAGSGKTQVLATRFSWLVMSEGIPASKILTLTFTKKAAAEMYSRIYSTLKFFARHKDVPSLERSRAETAIADFSQVHIQTLDSYCASIARQAANRYGINPDFGGNEKADDIELDALRFTLKNRKNPAVIFYSEDDLNLQAFSKKMFADNVKRYAFVSDSSDCFYRNFLLQRREIVSAWNKKVSAINDFIKEVNGIINEVGDEASNEFFVSLSKAVNQNVPELFLIEDEAQIERDDFPFEQFQQISAWKNSLKEIKTTKRKTVYSQAKDVLNEFISDEEIDAVVGFITEYKYLKEMMFLLDEFAESYRSQKRASGNLSVADISSLALKILVEQKDIRTQEKNAFSKIMIDEFQDNNRRNRDLLFLLSEDYDTFTPIPDYAEDASAIQKALVNHLEKEKLFFVGDEKQSIYKFRGADVSVFNQLKDDLKTEPLQMVYNYRSSGELLSSFNLLFGGWSWNKDFHTDKSLFLHEAQEKYEASYPEKASAKKVDVKTYEELSPSELNEQSIKSHLCFFNTDSIEKSEKDLYLDNKNQEAFFTAKKIHELYYSLPEEKRRWKDFAILDASTTNRNLIINWLNRFGVPFSLDSQRDIFQEAPVNDIYNYLRLCVFPADSKSFSAVLASPLAGLSETSVLNILAIQTSSAVEKFSAFNPECDKKIQESLSDSEWKKYHDAETLFSELRPKILSQPLTSTLDFLWNDTGYHYETLLNINVNLLSEQFDLLFELARQTDEQGKNCAWFVEQLELARNKNSSFFGIDSDDELNLKDLSYPLEKGDGVQIMTIHKSKGLQFKYVFIFGSLTLKTLRESAGGYYCDSFGFSLTQKNGYNYFRIHEKEEELKKLRAEYNRLIYVAATRAENEFYFVGSWGPLSDNSKKQFSDFEVIVSSYYDELRSNDFAKENPHFFKSGAPFDFTTIEPVLKNKAFAACGKNTVTSPDVLIKNAEKNFSAKGSLKFESPVSNRRLPSMLETEGKKEETDASDLYSELNTLIKNKNDSDNEEEASDDFESDELKDELFSSSSFGTLAHEYLCAMLSNVPPEKFSAPVKLYKNLSDSDKEKASEICRKMCIQFSKTKEGMRALNNLENHEFVKPEWGYYYYKDGYLYHGFIDLIFKDDDGKYMIVDYKSNDRINSEKYIEQQRCYRDAAAKMLGVSPKDVKCKLYFLRYDRFCELDFGD